MPTPPPTIDPAPTPAPQRGDRTTFSARVDAFVTWLTAAVAQFAAVALNTYNNAVEAAGFSSSAAVSANNAAASATAASLTSNVAPFNPATNYAAGQGAISGVNFQTYRRKTAGSSATDPANDAVNWERVVTSLGQGGETATGNLILTSASGGSQTVTPTGPGQSITLPDATTMQEGAGLFNLQNAGEFDIAIRNKAGTIKGFIRPLQNVVVGLSDNGTLAGVWSLDGAALLGVTGQRDFATAVSATVLAMQAIPLDTDRTLLLFGGTNVYGAVYDKSTQSWGAVTTVHTGLGVAFQAALSAANQVLLVVGLSSGNALSARTLTISGTSITPNAAATAAGATPTGFFDMVSVAAGFVLLWSSSGATNLTGFTVSGTTPTIGAIVSTSSNYTKGQHLQPSGASNVVALGGGATQIYAQAFSLSGATLTPGGIDTFTAPGTTVYFRSLVLPNGRIAASFHDGSTDAVARLYTLTGTSIAAANVSLVSATVTALTSDWAAVGSSKIVFGCASSVAASFRVNIIDASTGTPTVGAPVDVGIGTNSAEGIVALGSSGSSVKILCYGAASGDGGDTAVVSVDASGASPAVTVTKRTKRIDPGSAGFTLPSSSDRKTLRQPTTLTNGTLTTAVPNSPVGVQVFIGSSINPVSSSPMAFGTGVVARGGTSRECWSSRGNGQSLQLLEMAA